MVKAPPRGLRLTGIARRVLVLGALLLGIAAHASDQPQELPAIALNAGIHRIQAQVAATPEQRLMGLMHRQALAANEGMLFVFDRPQQQCFWMKNTPLPLSAAFLADDGSIVNIEKMQPDSEDLHCSTKPVRFVLEMNQGWFAKHGIGVGSSIRGGPFGHATNSSAPGQAPR